MDYSISKFLGVLNTNRGPAHKNRFSVVINLPISLAGQISGEDLNLSCSSAFIPSHRVVTNDYGMMSNPLKLPYSFTTEELSFVFLITNTHRIRSVFDQWLEMIVNTKTYEIAYKKDIIVDSWEVWQLDKSNVPVSGVKLRNVMPIQVSSIDYSNTSSEVVNLSVSVTYDRKEPLTST